MQSVLCFPELPGSLYFFRDESIAQTLLQSADSVNEQREEAPGA